MVGADLARNIEGWREYTHAIIEFINKHHFIEWLNENPRAESTFDCGVRNRDVEHTANSVHDGREYRLD